jgi:4-amino-4-deoxy-L-arabinose transferase-like glycosyltransferase
LNGERDFEAQLERRAVPLALAECALALGLGLVTLGTKSLWSDETYSASVASGTWRSMWESWRQWDANMTLYDVLLRAWRALGTSDAFLRSLSVLFATASVFVVFALGRRLFGATTGLVAGLLLATAPYFLQRSQEVRAYALLVLLVCGATYFLVVALESDQVGPWIGFTVCSALAFYAHFSIVLVFAAQAFSLVFVPRRELPTRRLLISAAALAVLCAPGMYLALTGRPDQLSWLPRPGWHAAIGQPSHVAGGAALSILFVGVLAVAVIAAARAWPTSWTTRWALGLVGAWLLVPPIAALVYSLVVSPVYLDRLLLISLPALVLAAAFGICRLPAAWALTALAVVLVVSTVRIVDWYRAPSFQDWRGVTALVLDHAQPGDGVAFCGKQQPFEYYVVNSSAKDPPGSIVPNAEWEAGYHAFTRAPIRAEDWPPRVWVITSASNENAEPASCFAHDLGARTRVSSTHFDGHLAVELWDDP